MNSKKQKITLAVSSFAGGGAERVMVTLANKFHEWGYCVDFIVFKNTGPYKDLLDKKINKIVLVDSNSNKFTNIYIANKKLKNYLKNSSPFVLMSTIREVNIFFAIIIFISGIKIRHVFREAATLDFSNGGIKNKVLLYLMRFFYKKSFYVIANSKITKDDLNNHISNISNKLEVIYNPLDLDVIKNSCLNPKSLERKTIVACGRLVYGKNFSDLIKSIPLVKEKYSDINLIILGEGEERDNLLDLINKLNLKGNVTLEGFVDNPYQYYATADVFVQTSLWEGFGYVLVEAMASGTPVVAYDSKGAMREILEDGRYGILTPVSDLKALADSIIEQIENPTSPEVLEEAVKRFDVNIIAKQYLAAMGIKHE